MVLDIALIRFANVKKTKVSCRVRKEMSKSFLPYLLASVSMNFSGAYFQKSPPVYLKLDNLLFLILPSLSCKGMTKIRTSMPFHKVFLKLFFRNFPMPFAYPISTPRSRNFVSLFPTEPELRFAFLAEMELRPT